MAIKMIMTDLDRTLLRDDKTISPYTLSILETARAQGIGIGIATARPQGYVQNVFPALHFDYAAFHNGAVVTCGNGNTLYFGIDSDVTLSICKRILADFPGRRIVVEMADKRYSNFPAEEIWPDVMYERTAFHSLPEGVAEKILLPDVFDGGAAFKAYLPEGLYLQMTDGSLCLIMNRQAEKLAGIRAICEANGVALSEVAAFGDDLNDAAMLKACGMGVAVANALEAVKASADVVCGSNEEDGVAKWIAAHLLSSPA